MKVVIVQEWVRSGPLNVIRWARLSKEVKYGSLIKIRRLISDRSRLHLKDVIIMKKRDLDRPIQMDVILNLIKGYVPIFVAHQIVNYTIRIRYDDQI